MGTFGYMRCDDGKVRIYLHHSSIPYSAAPALPAPVTELEVKEVQSKWAAAIKQISKVHKEGGDYIGAAAEAAGELYAYGHSNVLFKPTRAARRPRRRCRTSSAAPSSRMATLRMRASRST